MENEKIIVLDFGGQYNQLIARRVRECGVYCEIYSYRTSLEELRAMNPKGIILPAAPTVYMIPPPRPILRMFLILEFPSSESAMVLSS